MHGVCRPEQRHEATKLFYIIEALQRNGALDFVVCVLDIDAHGDLVRVQLKQRSQPEQH